MAGGSALFDSLFTLPGVDAPPGVPGEHIRLLDRSTVTGAQWVLASRAAKMWRVFHDEYELCFLPPDANDRHGGATYVYRQWLVSCRPGAVYFLEPDTLHDCRRIYGPSDYYVVKVEPERVAALGYELGLGERPHFRAPSTDSPRLMAAVAALSSAVATGTDGLEQEVLLTEVLRMALRGSGEGHVTEPRDPSARALAWARDYLHTHATTPVTLADLAKATGLSRYHLIRSFGRAYGLPPHAYQNQLRVAEARRQLAAGTPPAAVEVGFFDQSHLARHFKRAYAVTPAAYQRAILS